MLISSQNWPKIAFKEINRGRTLPGGGGQTLVQKQGRILVGGIGAVKKSEYQPEAIPADNRFYPQIQKPTV